VTPPLHSLTFSGDVVSFGIAGAMSQWRECVPMGRPGMSIYVWRLTPSAHRVAKAHGQSRVPPGRGVRHGAECQLCDSTFLHRRSLCHDLHMVGWGVPTEDDPLDSPSMTGHGMRLVEHGMSVNREFSISAFRGRKGRIVPPVGSTRAANCASALGRQVAGSGRLRALTDSPLRGFGERAPKPWRLIRVT
jgi:hypothetical protein